MSYIIEEVYKEIVGEENNYVQISSMDCAGNIFKIYLSYSRSVKDCKEYFVPITFNTLNQGADAWLSEHKKSTIPMIKCINEICKDLKKHKSFLDHLIGLEADIEKMLEFNKKINLGGIME